MVNAMFPGPRRGPGLAASLTFFSGLILCAATLASAQTAPERVSTTSVAGNPGSASAPWVPPHTAWGDPDLQGVWSGFESITLERPLELGDKEFFTDAEIADRIAKGADKAQERKDLVAEGKVEHEGFRDVPNYNAIFEYSESSEPPHMSKRTAAIVDPPNGRVPPWTLDQVKYWEEREAVSKDRGESDNMDDINLPTRCISVVTQAELTNWGMAFGGGKATAPGRPNAPVIGEDIDIGDGYGVNASAGPGRRIIQSPGFVTFVMGDVPVYRIVPLDGSPHPSNKIREWLGDARAHWEGNTLVVDIANIRFGSSIIANYGGSLYPGSGEMLHVIERFTRVDNDKLEYRYTIDDPKVYVRPYTVLHMLRKDDSRADQTTVCQEDPKDRAYFLSNARADEAASLASGEDSVEARKPRFEQLKQEAVAAANGQSAKNSTPIPQKAIH